MTQIDPFYLALLVLYSLLGGLCLAVVHGREDPRGVRLWGFSLLLYSAAVMAGVMGLPYHPRRMVVNSIISLAPVFAFLAFTSYTTMRVNRRWLAAGSLLTIAVIIVNHLGPHFLVALDSTASTPIAVVLFAMGAHALLRRGPVDVRRPARFVAGVLLFGLLLWLGRAITIWSVVGTTSVTRVPARIVSWLMIGEMAGAVAATFGLLWMEVGLGEAALRKLAEVDPLTNLPNRRITMERFDRELRRSMRHRRSFALLLLDVDSFKAINDGYGHPTGDAVLRHLGAVLSSTVRDVDAVGRFGGEEFAVLLTEEQLAGAIIAAERFRHAIEAAPFVKDSVQLEIRVSGGIAMYPEDGADWDAMFAAADARLYVAKSTGRNRIVAPEAVLQP